MGQLVCRYENQPDWSIQMYVVGTNSAGWYVNQVGWFGNPPAWQPVD